MSRLGLGPGLAENLRRFHNELVKQGFSDEESVRIICAWIRGGTA